VSRLDRLRAFRVGPTLFRRISWGALAALFVIICSGAVVRLTASGLGCDNWPRCGDSPFPAKDFHAIVEFQNRVLGLVPITLSFVLWLAARRTHGLPRWVVWLALGVFLGTITQAPLGGLTVILDLHPLLVMSHFLLAMLVLGGAVVVSVEAWSLERGRSAPLVPPLVRAAAAVVAVSALAVVVTGAFVTAAGPHSGGADIERLGSALTAMWVHVRATAVFGIAFLGILGYLAVFARRTPLLLAGAFGLLAVVLAQVAVGETQYRTELPWWLVLVHVLLAASIWSGSVALAAVFFRPPLPVAGRRDEHKLREWPATSASSPARASATRS
jgi:cytochrome c oxidase assembly protein subunit 15